MLGSILLQLRGHCLVTNLCVSLYISNKLQVSAIVLQDNCSSKRHSSKRLPTNTACVNYTFLTTDRQTLKIKSELWKPTANAAATCNTQWHTMELKCNRGNIHYGCWLILVLFSNWSLTLLVYTVPYSLMR